MNTHRQNIGWWTVYLYDTLTNQCDCTTYYVLLTSTTPRHRTPIFPQFISHHPSYKVIANWSSQCKFNTWSSFRFAVSVFILLHNCDMHAIWNNLKSLLVRLKKWWRYYYKWIGPIHSIPWQDERHTGHWINFTIPQSSPKWTDVC